MLLGLSGRFRLTGDQIVVMACKGELLERLHLTSERVTGKLVEELLSGEALATFLRLWEQLMSGDGHLAFEEELGGRYYSGVLYREESGGDVFVSVVDQTEQFQAIGDYEYRYRQLLSVVRDSEIRYERLLRMLPEPMIVHEDGILVYANDAAVRLIGADSAEPFIGKSLFDFVHPAHVDILYRRIQFMKEKQSPTEFMEIEIVNLEKQKISVEISSSYIYKEVGLPLIQTVIRDLTARKRSEELIIRSEKLSMIGQLAAGVAHEIRNPLTSLKGFTQLLKSGRGNPDYYQLMLQELDRINQIVNEFVVVAKPHDVSYSEHDLGRILDDVVMLMSMQAIISRVQIQKLWGERPYPLVCNEDQLKQVFINLLKNAIEVMPSGGEIQVMLDRQADRTLRVRIVDQGPGFPEELIERLGEPFLTTKESGTGLGLMISMRMIEAHHGSMTICSEKGIGTEVQIVLPGLD